MANDVVGINLIGFIEGWYWGGNPAGMKDPTDMLKEAAGHMCLQHANRLSARRFSGGCRQLVPMLQEFIAFLPRCAVHITTEVLL